MASSTRLMADGCQAIGDIDVAEAPGSHHEHLGCATLFRRTAVVAHAAAEAPLGEVAFHRRRGQQRGRPEHVVAAAMAVPTGCQRPWLGDAGNLGKSR